MSNHKIFCIIGRTASGKSTIAREVAERLGLTQIKSYTTRKPRLNELQHSDHIFITEEEYSQYKDDIVAYTYLNNAHYFCTKTQIMNSDIYVIDPIGVYYLQEKQIEGLEIIPIYIYADAPTRVLRFTSRGESIENFLERDKKECEQFAQYEIEKSFALSVNNTHDLEKAIQQVAEFIVESKGGECN